MKTKIAVLMIIAVLASAGITYTLMKGKFAGEHIEAGHADADDHGSEGVKISGIQFAKAAVGTGWDTLTVTGKVIVPPDRLVKISPRIEGKIVAARGTVGDTVNRGQVLAVISSVELAEARAQYRKALATLSAARKNLQREMEIARLGAVSVRPVEEARAESLTTQGELADAKSELSQAKSELTQAESELVQCKARLQRARELYAGKIVSKQDLETAEADVKKDSAAVDAAKSKVGQAEARIQKADAKTEIAKQYLAREEKVYKGRVMDMRAVQSAKSEVASAQVEVQAAADGIRVLGASPGGSGETIAIVSPITGQIISRNTNIGEMATPSDTLFTVANQSQVWVEADVYEKDIAKVRKDQIAEIRVDAYPDRVFSGRIDSISDILSSESRTAKVRCVVPNSSGLLRGEMFARILLITGKRGNCVFIPKQAVLDDDGKKIVFTPCMDCKEDIEAGKSVCGNYDKLVITTGPVHGDKVEILSGLEPGTEVVTVGAYQLKTALGSGKLEAGCADEE
ncbi:MAG: efflux RND transporter periplasmic adaptor subunit [Armatimonadota bacterium]|nr:efflux RND transporter periplasmic adaptor subunit [Armatimonadota bacterium]